MSRTDFNTLLEAGAHFGHLKRKWNPKMAPYIFMEKNGIHIIDLHKTVLKIDEAAAAIKQIAKSGRRVLFVATKKQAKDIVAEKVAAVGMPYVTERWAGGMLTNFPTIRKAVKKMSTIDKMATDGTFDNSTKSIAVVLEAMCAAIAEGTEERKLEKEKEAQKADAEGATVKKEGKPRIKKAVKAAIDAEEAAVAEVVAAVETPYEEPAAAPAEAAEVVAEAAETAEEKAE